MDQNKWIKAQLDLRITSQLHLLQKLTPHKGCSLNSILYSNCAVPAPLDSDPSQVDIVSGNVEMSGRARNGTLVVVVATTAIGIFPAYNGKIRSDDIVCRLLPVK